MWLTVRSRSSSYLPDIPSDMPVGSLMAPQIPQSFTTLMPSAAAERRLSTHSVHELDTGPVVRVDYSGATNNGKMTQMFLTFQTGPAQYVPTITKELINRLTGKGLSLAYRFTRGPNIYSSRMLSVELTFTNNGDKAIDSIRMREKVSHSLPNILLLSSRFYQFSFDCRKLALVWS